MIYRELQKLKPSDTTAEIKLLGEYDPEKQLIIEDPYYVCTALCFYSHSKVHRTYIMCMDYDNFNNKITVNDVAQ